MNTLLCAVALALTFQPSADMALAQLRDALTSRDEHVYDAAVSDLVNGKYRTLPADELKRVLLPTLKKPETTPVRQRGQSFVMEYLARHYGPKAREAIPDLLKIIRDDKLSSYLRGQAIDAAAKIGFGDPALVAAFVDAIENPSPKDSSGVHNRAAYLLGDMGKAAWPAKKAIAKLLDHPWYRDPAYISLGKLAMDDPPQPLAV
jgi:HEAT repeat protein